MANLKMALIGLSALSFLLAVISILVTGPIMGIMVLEMSIIAMAIPVIEVVPCICSHWQYKTCHDTQY